MKALLLLVAGAVLGGLVVFVGLGTDSSSSHPDKPGEADPTGEPLYWVAPMDPNFRRDGPGKSPMGMDLVPVYADDSEASGPGSVSIDPRIEQNLGVRVAPVEVSEFSDRIDTVGYVRYNEDNLIHVHPRVTGWIETLYVTAEGERVEQGAPLYSLYSPELVNAQEEYLLARQRGNDTLIRAAYQRLEALHMPQSQIDALEKRNVAIQHVLFDAPQSGVIDNLNVREGFYVNPEKTLMAIAALDEVWVEAEVFERQAAWVKTGLPANMSLAFLPGEVFEGELDYIYPTLDPATRTVRVRMRFNNPGGKLKPNMFAQVSIMAAPLGNVLSVPLEAVIRTGKQDRVVMALGNGQFKSVEVSLGMIANNRAQILSGLNAGDRVVTSAQFLLDSESSISSDFARIQGPDEQPQSVWMNAMIFSLSADTRVINASHEEVPEWDWPAMVMDFQVSESVDFSALKEDMSLHIEVTRASDGSIAITNVHIMDEPQASVESAIVDGTVNSIDRLSRVANISRGPIEKWGRGPATMDFLVDEHVDIDSLASEDSIRFRFVIREGDFVVVEVFGDAHGNHEGMLHD